MFHLKILLFEWRKTVDIVFITKGKYKEVVRVFAERLCEHNGGKGYADIAIIPRDGKGPSAVIELKDEDKNSDNKRMRDVADSAIDQIFKLRYFADLHGDIQLYGMATRQTDAFMSYRKIRR